jgi:hypothetical protein
MKEARHIELIALAIAALAAIVGVGRTGITPPGSADVEQTTQGRHEPARLVASFDGLGIGFSGPQGTVNLRNPSDNTLAVGRDHIVQIVNTRMAVFTKKGKRFDTTGKVLYGAVETRNVFKDFGGPCEQRNNGDAVVRYDQLADRWLIVMPIFSRGPKRADEPTPGKDGEPARTMVRGQPGQPGAAHLLFQPRTLPLDSQSLPCHLARWLLHPVEHRRRGDPEARLRR